LNKVPADQVRCYVTELGLAKKESGWGKRGDQTYHQRFKQAVLAASRDNQIVDVFNRLLALGAIPTPEIELL
jgi:hypothetical protein